MNAQNDDFELDFDDESTPNTTVNEDNSPADTTPAVEVTTETASEPVPDAFTEPAPTVVSEKTDEEKAAEKAQAEADKAAAVEAAQKAHDEFVAAVESVMVHDDRDAATGVIPEVLTQQVLDAYAALPGTGGKAAGRKYLSDTMMAKMVAGAEDPNNFLLARSYMELEKRVGASKAKRNESAGRPKVDPTDAFAEQVAALMLAPSLVSVPADVEDTWVDKAQALVESLTGDLGKYQEWVTISEKETAEGTDTEKATPAPEVSPIILAAAKVATGRAAGRPRKSGTGTTPRVSTAGSGHTGDIAQHLTEVFEGVASGTFLSVAEIAKGVTSQYGGDKPAPSQGAVSARLFPKNGEFKLDIGITPATDPKKGAVKN